jgi:hypothetical protein
MEGRRHDEFAHACTLVLGSQASSMDSIVDEAWALGSRTMWFKLADRGWSLQRWGAWFARVLLDAILRPSTRSTPIDAIDPHNP